MKNLLLVAFVLFILLSCQEKPIDRKIRIKSIAKTFHHYADIDMYFVIDSLAAGFKSQSPDDSIFIMQIDSLLGVIANSRDEKEKAREEALAAKEKAEKALEDFRKRQDEFDGSTFYRHKTSPKYVNQNGFFCYFSTDKEGKILPLRLKIQYYANDWLFIRRCEVLADGQKFNYTSGDFSRDNEGGKIWEYNDGEVNEEIRMMLQVIADSKVAKIRFVGDQYHKDKTISSSQKKALREVLEVHEALSSPLL